MIYYPQKENDSLEMKNIFHCLHIIIKIFYDLNAQVCLFFNQKNHFFNEEFLFLLFKELPEHFEDNIKLYMTHFLTLLSYEPTNRIDVKRRKE